MGISNNTVSELIKHSQKHFNPRRVFRPRKVKPETSAALQTLQEILDAEPCDQTAPNPVAQPPQARFRLLVSESEAAKAGILDRWQAAQNRKLQRESRRTVICNKLQEVLNQLESIAQSNHWSQRKLADKAGLPESTLRRIKRGNADPKKYLPQLHSAAARLQPA